MGVWKDQSEIVDGTEISAVGNRSMIVRKASDDHARVQSGIVAADKAFVRTIRSKFVRKTNK